jgi:hypothetical protein
MRKGRPPSFPLWKPPVLHLVGHFLRNGTRAVIILTESADARGEATVRPR